MSVEVNVVDITEGKAARKKVPKEVAVVEHAGCTGCEACIAFCPVDCIEIIPGLHHPDMNKLVEIDLDRCIGCKLCAKYCPWETIFMYDYAEGLEIAPSVTTRSVCDQAAEMDTTA